MKKTVKILCLLIILAITFTLLSVMRDKQQLSSSVIRLHVVADSDSARDQFVKLRVKDAVVAYLSSKMNDITDFNHAKTFLEDNREVLLRIAQNTLRSEAVDDPVSISMEREPFPVRKYDTFTLPSGVYTSLRINIGKAAGQNWWCVVFPTLCMSASQSEYSPVFSDSLNHTIRNENEYEVRFLLLDWLGSLENFFFKS